ncbi:MAG TPA: xanthine dehydrogenase family protein molybdopterin-binding subunit [Chloroflexota bacterium]|nr:xanthine dehydrogenase family protein molybdopterin-binding subunit [Chloroflexota bacterium]
MAQLAAIGHSIKRVDGERKVTGAARYTGDLQLPGMLHARLVLSAHPRARITGVARDEAAKVPGVVGIFTAADLEFKSADTGSRTKRPLAEGEVFFEGQPIAVVVAESVAVAQDAADLVEVDYEVLPSVGDPEAAMREGSPLARPLEDVHAREDAGAHAAVGGGSDEEREPLPPNAVNAVRFQRGDVDAALRDADVVIERTYRTSWVHQAHLEPQSSVVAPDWQGGLQVWTSTQGSFTVRELVADVVGMPQHRVNVTAMDVGGGFGAKYGLLDPLAAVLALKLQRPVSLIYTRAEEFRSANPAPGAVLHVTTGAGKDGTLAALRARVIMEDGAYQGEGVAISCLLIGGSYKWPNLDIHGYDVLTNKTGAGAYRAPGAPQAAFAIEGNIEEMARALGLDPLQFRLQNVIAEGDPLPPGNPLPRVGGRECLEAVAQHPLWQNRRPGDGTAVGFGWWPGGLQPASAGCRLNEDGTLSVLVGSVDISGSNTSLALIAAEAFGVPVDLVAIRQLDTVAAPFAGPSGGSKTIYTVGAAVRQAAEDARRQVLAIAAQHLEAAVEDLELKDGQISVHGVPGRGVSLEQVAAMSVGWSGSFEPVLGKGGSAITSSAPGFAAHLVRVAVDEETGLVQVLDYVAAQDVGRAINPAEVDGQIHGGVSQGIGWALYEAIPYDDEGRLLGASLMDYALPTAEQVPDIETITIEIPSNDGPFGAKGVGEPPIIPGAAAIANAILDATGVRPTALPMTPPRVLRAMQQRR